MTQLQPMRRVMGAQSGNAANILSRHEFQAGDGSPRPGLPTRSARF
jgi:hypothetical protein